MASIAARILTFSSTGEVGGTWASTGGVATKKWHGIGDDVTFSIVENVEAVPSVGWYGPGPVAAEIAQSAEGTIPGVLTYEDAPNLLNALFAYTSASTGNTTGGTTAPYYYSWTAPVTSTQACATYPMEYGTSGQAYKLNGVIFNGLTITGESPGYWRFSIPALAKSVQTLAAMTTAANVDRTVNPVKMADTSLYVDDFDSGTMGGTAVTATLINFEFTLDAGRHLKHMAGSKYAQGWGDNKMSGTLRTLLEFGSTAKAYIDELLHGSTSTGSTGAEVERQIRIKASQGSSATLKSMAIDFAGIIAEPIQLWENRDGNLVVNVTWSGKYSTQLTNWLRAIVENGSSSTT